jgi:fructose-1,6-bisphosphatase I
MSQQHKVAPPTGLEETDSVTLTRFVLHEQRKHPESQGDLTLLLTSVQLACKVTDSCVRKAGIAKLYGLAGGGNVSGDLQQKLDVISNETFKVNIESSQKVAVMVSEEEELPIIVEKHNRGKYGIAFDPLDGSSNIDSNVTIGSIFGIFRLPDGESIQTTDEACRQIMQPGRNMVAAGYAMYGSATNLVLSFGNGVHGFTLDPSLGEFVLTHPNIRIPRRGKIYSVNEGNCKNWDKPVVQYIQSLKFPSEGKSPYSLRYIGSMVADVHRTLLYGGIFCYPADKKNPNGKLRLLYEGAPMAFLMEQAGGKASTGTENILDIQPHSIHQRTPVFMGSYEDVCDLESFFKSASQ